MHTECFTHGRVRRKHIKEIDPSADTGRMFTNSKSVRNYFTSVKMDLWSESKCKNFLECSPELYESSEEILCTIQDHPMPEIDKNISPKEERDHPVQIS